MKKNKFFTGLSKIALAVVALATTTFTSCEKEDFGVEIVVNPAEVYIVPEVRYIDLAAGTYENVTSLADIQFQGATAEGKRAYIKGTEANPTIAATTVTVTASYKGKTSEPTTVNVSEIKTGQVTYTPIIVIMSDMPVPPTPEEPEPQPEYTYSIKVLEGQKEVESDYIWGKPTVEGHGYTHDGSVWNENASEYFITVNIKYPVIMKSTITNWEDILTDADNVKPLVTEAYNMDKSYIEEMPYTASAYSIFRAWYKTTTTTQIYIVVRKEIGNESAAEEIVAKFYLDYTSSTAAGVVEKAHPSHAGHYHQGHGHGTHGNADNAGGGIVWGD